MLDVVLLNHLTREGCAASSQLPCQVLQHPHPHPQQEQEQEQDPGWGAEFQQCLSSGPAGAQERRVKGTQRHLLRPPCWQGQKRISVPRPDGPKEGAGSLERHSSRSGAGS